MKAGQFLPVLFGIIFFSIAIPAGAQPYSSPGQGWGPESPYAMLYDSTTEMTIVGRVVHVEDVPPTPGSAPAVLIFVATAQGLTVPVYLGPAWYIMDQGVVVNAGDLVQVAGSRVTMHDQSVMIASWVERGNHLLVLRDDYGFPVWGWP